MNLEETRKEIDEINKEMLRLFQRRMDCAISVAEYKKENGMAIFDSNRENLIIEKMSSLAEDKYKPYTVDFFRNLMAISRDWQAALLSDPACTPVPRFVETVSPTRIIYQGTSGSYSSEVHSLCFPDTQSSCVKTFEEVFVQVMENEDIFGILPIENSSTGTITEVYNLLVRYKPYITAEKIIKIDHKLIGKPGAKIEDITEIFSHPQGFLQCSDYLSTLPGKIRQTPYYNTAISVKRVAESEGMQYAAIGSEVAAKLYGLEILKDNINNNDHNYTRFIIISKNPIIPRRAKKVSVVFGAAHESGGLMRCLRAFAKKELNLIKLESRPHPDNPWQYMFFADFEGDFNKSDISDILPFIMQETTEFIFLGNYEEL